MDSVWLNSQLSNCPISNYLLVKSLSQFFFSLWRGHRNSKITFAAPNIKKLIRFLNSINRFYWTRFDFRLNRFWPNRFQFLTYLTFSGSFFNPHLTDWTSFSIFWMLILYFYCLNIIYQVLPLLLMVIKLLCWYACRYK